MAKISTVIVEGWAMMTPLGRREAALLAQELNADERVRGQAIATYSQTLVVTDRRVLVIKGGAISGRAFGGVVTTFDFADIRAVEVRMRIAQGDFEIVTAETEKQRAGTWVTLGPLERTNTLVFGKLDAEAFTSIADRIREQMLR